MTQEEHLKKAGGYGENKENEECTFLEYDEWREPEDIALHRTLKRRWRQEYEK